MHGHPHPAGLRQAAADLGRLSGGLSAGVRHQQRHAAAFRILRRHASARYTLGRVILNGEARYSNDSKTATQTIYALYTSNYINAPATYHFKSNKPSFTFTASYKLPGAGKTLFYAKVGTGYRAGAVNSGNYVAAAPNPLQFTYGTENTIGYEAGVKSSLTRNLYLRLSAYLSRTDDAITSVNDGCTVTNACGQGATAFNVNGGRIHARGFEAAIDGRFTVAGGQLLVGLNGANQRATFAWVPTGAGLPFLDTKVAQIPDWTMSATVDYKHAITDSLTGKFNLSYSGQRGGGQDTVTLATPFIPLENIDYFSLSAGVTYRKIGLSIFVRNLTDQAVQVLKLNQGAIPLSVRYNQPRTIGGSVSYRW